MAAILLCLFNISHSFITQNTRISACPVSLWYCIRKVNYFHKAFKKKGTDLFKISTRNIVNFFKLSSSVTGLPFWQATDDLKLWRRNFL